jgi:large subunit ribosomal protein L7/L12
MIGINGFPTEFLEKLKSGEMFNPIDLASSMVASSDAGSVVEDDGPKEEIFDVVLRGFKAEGKLKIIKELKSLLDLGLKEAKEIVEGTAKQPFIIYKRIDKADKLEIVDKLKELGAEVEFE